MRSLQRALNKDETARRLIKPEMDSLFTSEPGTEDEASGTIYVCRSHSDHPFVAENRDIVHNDWCHHNEDRTPHSQCRDRPDLYDGRCRGWSPPMIYTEINRKQDGESAAPVV